MIQLSSASTHAWWITRKKSCSTDLNFYFLIGENNQALPITAHILTLIPDYDSIIFSEYARLVDHTEEVLQYRSELLFPDWREQPGPSHYGAYPDAYSGL